VTFLVFFLSTVTHFMVVVLHLGLFAFRTRNTTHKERFKTTNLNVFLCINCQ